MADTDETRILVLHIEVDPGDHGYEGFYDISELDPKDIGSQLVPDEFFTDGVVFVTHIAKAKWKKG